MSDQNIPFYLQKYTATFTKGVGTISYVTVGLIPSNEAGKRVAVIEISGTLSISVYDYEITMDFSNVVSPYELTLEGPVQGQLNIGKCISENAAKYISYDASKLVSQRILKLFIQNDRIKKNDTLFYFNITIKDQAITPSFNPDRSYNGVSISDVVISQLGNGYQGTVTLNCGSGSTGCTGTSTYTYRAFPYSSYSYDCCTNQSVPFQYWGFQTYGAVYQCTIEKDPSTIFYKVGPPSVGCTGCTGPSDPTGCPDD